MKKICISFIIIFFTIALVAVMTRCRHGNLSSEGILVFAVETRPLDRPLAGIHGVRMGTGRGIWKQSLELPSQQARLIQACSQEPWCTNTDSRTTVVFGCRGAGILYDVQRGRMWRLELPLGKRLITLSLRGKFALLISGDKLLVMKYKIVKDRIIWTEKKVLPNMPLPQSVHFSPKGPEVLMESGGWTYVIPTLGQRARKVFQARAVGWMPDGRSVIIYDDIKREILLYDLHRDRTTVMAVSQQLLTGEIPVAVSPSGHDILTIRPRSDAVRLLPDVKTFCVRDIRQGQEKVSVSAGWRVRGSCWLSPR